MQVLNDFQGDSNATFYATSQSGHETNNYFYANSHQETYNENAEPSIMIELHQEPLTPVANLLTTWGYPDFIDRFHYHGIEIEHFKLLNDTFLTYLLNGWPLSRILNFKIHLDEFVSIYIKLLAKHG